VPFGLLSCTLASIGGSDASLASAASWRRDAAARESELISLPFSAARSSPGTTVSSGDVEPQARRRGGTRAITRPDRSPGGGGPGHEHFGLASADCRRAPLARMVPGPQDTRPTLRSQPRHHVRIFGRRSVRFVCIDTHSPPWRENSRACRRLRACVGDSRLTYPPRFSN
jgi:hypothetical protein